MPTDDERREVARKLRKKHGQRSCDFVGQCMGLQLETMATDIMDCIPKGETLLVLADLIDPDSIPDNPDKTERPLSEPEIDRDALLALADDLDYAGANVENVACIDQTFHDAALRTRKAVGA